MKIIRQSIELIEHQLKSRIVTLMNNETWIDCKSGNLEKKKEPGYILRIESDVSLSSMERYFINTTFDDGTKYLIPNMNVIRQEGSLIKRGSIVTIHISEYSELSDGIEENNKFYRLIIPISENNSISLMRIFETSEYTSETSKTFEYFDFEINGLGFELFIMFEDGKKYLAIDCKNLVDYQTFDHICFSILLTVSLFSGKFVQGDLYYLNSSSVERTDIKLFKYREMEESSNNHYCIFAPNPHGIINDSQKASKFGKDIFRLKKDQFEKIVSLVLSDDKVANLLLISHQSMQQSLVSMSITLSVCLEILSSISAFKSEDDIKKPINNEALKKKVIEELVSSLMKFKEDILKDDGVYDVLERKIINLNSPLNSDKLIEPFENLGIILNEKDHHSIKNRNRILHGSKLLKYYANDIDHKEADELFDISLNLYFLISCIFMKYINYTGYILDIRNIATGIKELDEDSKKALFIKLT